mmetsp:Transcript_30524/g.98660  ORF Transcript_30524/g.98660 Transcript_30524/m.98660 type:complete len:206 (+) Transcript_30524:1759-2376(+)
MGRRPAARRDASRQHSVENRVRVPRREIDVGRQPRPPADRAGGRSDIVEADAVAERIAAVVVALHPLSEDGRALVDRQQRDALPVPVVHRHVQLPHFAPVQRGADEGRVRVLCSRVLCSLKLGVDGEARAWGAVLEHVGPRLLELEPKHVRVQLDQRRLRHVELHLHRIVAHDRLESLLQVGRQHARLVQAVLQLQKHLAAVGPL